MYARIIDGVEYKFGVSGKLYRNGLIMYDDVTGSLWSHVDGQAIVGEMTGTKLEVFPAIHTDWATWKDLHPETLVIAKSKSPSPRDSFGRDPYEDYYRDESSGVIGWSNRDQRLSVKQHVIGLRIGDQVKAYPFSVLNDEPVVNDELADTALAVFFHRWSGAGAVFDRRVGDRTLSFRLADEADSDNFVVVDQETGTRWLALTGEAIEGTLAGERLTAIPTTEAFWFGWVDYYPDTLLYGEKD